MTFLGNPDGMYHFCGEIVKFSADGEYKTDDTKIQEAMKAAGFKVKKAVKGEYFIAPPLCGVYFME